MASGDAKPENRFGDWLNIELGRREWSQRQLAEKVGVSSGVVSRWVRGIDIPSSPSIFGIASALGVPPQVVMHQIGAAPDATQADFWGSLSEKLDTEDLQDVQEYINFKIAQAQKRSRDK